MPSERFAVIHRFNDAFNRRDFENAMEEWHGSGLEGAKTIGEEKA